PARVRTRVRYLGCNSNTTASTAEMVEPATVAQPAPAIPRAGRPQRPKIKVKAKSAFTGSPTASTNTAVQLSPRPAKKLLTAATIKAGSAAKHRQRKYTTSSSRIGG